MTETEGNLIEALDEVQDLHDARIADLERRVDFLEKMQAGGLTAAAAMASRTVPLSQEMSMTGKSDNPAQIDAQEILLRARAGDRKHMPVHPVKYGSRP